MGPVARLITVASLAMSSAGCVTMAGGKLPNIEPQPPENPPNIEQTVGNFSFHLDGGKMITSNRAGRSANKQILGFRNPTSAQEPGPAHSVVERLHLLERLRADGVLTEKEYQRKRWEALQDL